MTDQRLFSPAHDNALEYFLAVRVQLPNDPGNQAALVDLQPQLVIAAEQAMAHGNQPEAVRLVDLLQKVDDSAPALGRLRTSLAEAERLAREREQAVDAETRALAERAEAELRRQAEANVARLAALRPTPTPSIPEARPVAVAPNRTPADVAIAPAPAAPVRISAASQPDVPTPPPAARVPSRAVVAEPPRNAVPKLIREVAPIYPESGTRRKLSGQVQVSFTIDADGDVKSPQVLSSNLPALFQRAALSAASRWKFEATGRTQTSSRTVEFAPPAG